MPSSNRCVQIGFVRAAIAIAALYAGFGAAKAWADWRWIDIAGEGGTAVMAACWMWIVLGSRPAGRVTLLLALGLAGLALGAWADALDELFAMQAVAPRFDKWLESGLMPLGMVLLTLGLVGWRREQFQLSDHMRNRERLFREHRAFDRITQLAHAEYLGEQLRLEQARDAARPAALLMLEITGLAPLLHAHGRRDGVRALQAVTHQVLLNLRNDDLLCRYAGDRFLLLLPQTGLESARRCGAHLEQMVTRMAFHAGSGERVALGLRSAAVVAQGEAAALMAALNRALESDHALLAQPA